MVGTLGTTLTGAIDDLSALSSLARQHGAWFHIDAAYGGFFTLVDSIKLAAKGVEMADSITLDAHKSLFMPFGCAMLLLRERAHLSRGNFFRPKYLDQKYYDGDAGDAGEVGDTEDAVVAGDVSRVSFCDFSPELTRGFRGLRVWLPLLFHGTLPFKAALQEKLQLAQVCYRKLLEAMPGLVVMGPFPQLSIVTFRFIAENSSGQGFQKDLDFKLNTQVQTTIELDGTVIITNVDIDGWRWLRMCILNFRTHLEDIEIAVRKVKEAYNAVAAQQKIFGAL